MSDLFENIVQTVREPLLVLTSGLRVHLANRSFYATFGLIPEQVVGCRLDELGSGQWNAEGLRRALEEILPNHGAFSDYELHQDFGTAGVRTLLLNGRQISDPSGRSSLILLAMEDVTAQRLTSQALDDLNQRLRRSNSELQEFAQVASHDLQEPLRKIQAFGDRLKLRSAGELSAENQDYLNRMLNAASRMQTLINDLLAFCRVESRGESFTPVDLQRVAREVISDLESEIGRSGAEIRIQGVWPVVRADALQMRQLLQNLLSNALKYRREGIQPCIVVRGALPEDSRRSSRLILEVEDNGIGFDEKYLDRIFTVFQRLHGRNQYPGTGIGLAICRRIADRHGGTITARSIPGQGSIFVVTLPLDPGAGGI